MASYSTGDVVAPTELIIPVQEGTKVASNTGQICLSGSKLYFYTGAAWELVTSA